MKPSKTLLFFLLLLSGGFVFAQGPDFDSYMERKPRFSCEEIAETSSLLFCDYVKRGDLDSAAMLLSYWNDKCHDNEAVERARILLSIKTGTYSNDSLSYGAIWDMMEFKRRLATERGEGRSYYSYLEPGCEFDLFTREWAAEMKAEQDENSIEYLWCEFYSGETSGTLRAISEMDKSVAPRLVEEAKSMKAEIHRRYGLNMAFMSGVWMPVGELSIFGVHPEIGFQVGFQWARFTTDFSVLGRSMNTKKPYTYRRYVEERKDGYVYQQSNSFEGIYMGLDLGYIAYQKKRHQVDVLLGGGMDAISEIGYEEGIDDKDDTKSREVKSFNINLGVGYRYYFYKGVYLGVKAKCNFVNYSDRRLIDYKGHPFTIHFTIGGLFEGSRDDYKERDYWFNY